MDDLQSPESRPKPRQGPGPDRSASGVGVYNRPEGAGARKRWMSTGLIVAILLVIAILLALFVF
jgi:hypothetical protein